MRFRVAVKADDSALGFFLQSVSLVGLDAFETVLEEPEGESPQKKLIASGPVELHVSFRVSLETLVDFTGVLRQKHNRRLALMGDVEVPQHPEPVGFEFQQVRDISQNVGIEVQEKTRTVFFELRSEEFQFAPPARPAVP